MKPTKTNAIHYFSKTIEGYFQMVNAFTTNNPKIINTKYIVMKGVHLIVHLFKLFLLQTKNPKDASISATYAYNLYLEYIKQINFYPAITDLTMVDAIKFVVDKTMEEYNESTIERVVVLESAVYEWLDNLLNKCNLFFEWNNEETTTTKKLQLIVSGDFVKFLSS
jgi:predicted DNA-binding ArsR family transcriptional regulator